MSATNPVIWPPPNTLMVHSHEPPLPQLRPREADSHKGDYGRALLVGGSRGMSGAVALAGTAALRSGAGLVTIATADVCLNTVASFEPSYMTTPLACDSAGIISADATSTIDGLAQHATAIGCGPGIGRTADLVEVVTRMFQRLSQPAVFDADALFAIARRPDCLSTAAGPRILTPHEGEFDRFTSDVSDTREQREQQAIELAARHGLVIVLKGHRSLVTDGQRTYHNATGNPGMACGGSGDVLTGIVTALLCQGLDAFGAAQLGVHLHGLAGDLAAARRGEISLIPTDIVNALSEAFMQHAMA